MHSNHLYVYMHLYVAIESWGAIDYNSRIVGVNKRSMSTHEIGHNLMFISGVGET